ncbi:PREDICTED: very-long-chain 3-oxoacyl-CoA reductase 1-like isoform X2 [Populus euphratica]|uniref:Very-long-chain 3-oxoacyl-CoA reductase 1-like isoform X2 n=1 Tax=Populus euphratica TaxID=75702 RepID=A0AAJ6V687_POPEU|nr:PREDICTED: very-long-chain 3-oxoacyl-CoA reductase 1-like isoform X2 [Populus euphratica]
MHALIYHEQFHLPHVMEMELQAVFLVAVSCLGFVSLCKHIFCFLRWLWVMFLRPPKNLQEYGSWAIITGPTDGIGKALAFELASKGLNLVLVGRNPSKLEATSNEIRARFGDQQVDIKNVVVDFATCSGQEISKAIEGSIKELDVGVLINNAGVSCPKARFFHEVDWKMTESLIKVNSEAATWVTRAVLPAMLKKKKGAIVNMGSGSVAVLPSFPLFAIYASTKAYLGMFSRCIDLEYSVSRQVPLFVATKMTKLKKSLFLVASPEMYAKASIRCIGYEHLSMPLCSHSVQRFILDALPNVLLDWCTSHFFLGLRRKRLEKESLRAKGRAAAQTY